MKKFAILGIMAVAMILLFVGCADATAYTLAENAGQPYGFWGGVWHGMIMVPDFIGTLIWDDVAVYAVNNNGGWYDFGFIGGLSLVIRVIGNLLKGFFNLLVNGSYGR
jgi:hypothetical protein